MSASQTASSLFALATDQATGSEPSPGDAGSAAGGASGDSNAGASGKSSGALTLSKGVIAAIIIVVVVVVVFVVASAVLFYLSKKRNWQMREAMRQSARRVVRALTPRRMTFGTEADAMRSPTYRTGRDEKKAMKKVKEGDDQQILTQNESRKDLERGISKVSSFSVEEERETASGWERKVCP